jgi:hypothetical protein
MFLLVGCRDRSTVQDAQDKLCSELGRVEGSVAQIAAVEPGPGAVARIRQLRTQMEAQYADAQEAASDVGAIRTDAVNGAYQKFLGSLNGVNDEATLVQAQAQIDQAAGEFSTARLDLHTTAAC